jgi:DNA-binding response OmpR family regulator
MAILDWMMPGLDGVELCRRIRSHEAGPYKYVLLLTAKGSKEDVVAGLEAGADDYLTKPFDVNELRARVRAGKRILELQGALLRVQTE